MSIMEIVVVYEFILFVVVCCGEILRHQENEACFGKKKTSVLERPQERGQREREYQRS